MLSALKSVQASLIYTAKKVLFELTILVATYRTDARFMVHLAAIVLLGLFLSRNHFRGLATDWGFLLVSLVATTFILHSAEYYFHHFYRVDKSTEVRRQRRLFPLLFFGFSAWVLAFVYLIADNRLFVGTAIGIPLPSVAKKLGQRKQDVLCFHSLSLLIRAFRTSSCRWDVYFCYDVFEYQLVRPLYHILHDVHLRVWIDHGFSATGGPALNLNQAVVKGLYRSKLGVIYMSRLYLHDLRCSINLSQMLQVFGPSRGIVVLLASDISKNEVLEEYPSLISAQFKSYSPEEPEEAAALIITELLETERRIHKGLRPQ